MYYSLVRRYDLVNGLISWGRDRRWRELAVAELSGRGDVVDLAAGTGEMTLAYLRRCRPSGEVVLLDFNRAMLTRARQKISTIDHESGVHYVLGDFERLPFRSSCFVGALSAFALRNLPALAPAFGETHRVVQPEGQVVFLEATQPSGRGWRRLFNFYWCELMPRLAGLVNPGRREAYLYLARSVGELAPPVRIIELLRGVGFADCRFRSFMGGAVTAFFCRRPNALAAVEQKSSSADEKTVNELPRPT